MRRSDKVGKRVFLEGNSAAARQEYSSLASGNDTNAAYLAAYLDHLLRQDAPQDVLESRAQ